MYIGEALVLFAAAFPNNRIKSNFDMRNPLCSVQVIDEWKNFLGQSLFSFDQ